MTDRLSSGLVMVALVAVIVAVCAWVAGRWQAADAAPKEKESAFQGGGGAVKEPLLSSTEIGGSVPRPETVSHMNSHTATVTGRPPAASEEAKTGAAGRQLELHVSLPPTEKFPDGWNQFMGYLPRHATVIIIDRPPGKQPVKADVVAGTLFDGPKIQIARPSVIGSSRG